jgi:hypothetical protein
MQLTGGGEKTECQALWLDSESSRCPARKLMCYWRRIERRCRPSATSLFIPTTFDQYYISSAIHQRQKKESGENQPSMTRPGIKPMSCWHFQWTAIVLKASADHPPRVLFFLAFVPEYIGYVIHWRQDNDSSWNQTGVLAFVISSTKSWKAGADHLPQVFSS